MRGFYGIYSLYGVKGSFNVNKWVLLIPYMIETGGFDLLFSQCIKNVCEKGTQGVACCNSNSKHWKNMRTERQNYGLLRKKLDAKRRFAEYECW